MTFLSVIPQASFLTQAGGASPRAVALADGTLALAWSVETDPGRFAVRLQLLSAEGVPLGAEQELATALDEPGFELKAAGAGGLLLTAELGTPQEMILRSFEVANGVATEVVTAGPDDSGTLIGPLVSGSSTSDFNWFYISTEESDQLRALRFVGGEMVENRLVAGVAVNANAQVAAATLANGNTVLVIDRDGVPGTLKSFQLFLIDPLAQVVLNRNVSGPDRLQDPTVAALAGGGFVVAGVERDGDTDIVYQVFDAAGADLTALREFGIEDSNGASVNNTPVIAALPDGGFVIFYDKNDATREIRGQRFDSDGEKFGEDFRVFAGADAAQPTATTLADGRVVVSFVLPDGSVQSEVLRMVPADQVGGDGDDVLTGTDGDDLIQGLAGDDTITGGDGDDTIEGGDGADSMDGGAGNDTLSYRTTAEGVAVNLGLGAGTAGAAGDVYSGFENLVGSAFRDVLAGTSGANRIEGGAEGDVLNGLGGSDSLFGGDGGDRLEVDAAKDNNGALYDGGAGTDQLLVAGGSSSIDFTDDTIIGVEDLAFMNQAYQATFLASQFTFGRITVLGERNPAEAISVTILMGEATGLELGGLDLADFTVTGDRFVVTGDGDDEDIFGTSIADFINGGAGDDAIEGRAGNDTLRGSAGADSLFGGDGDDLMDGGAGGDLIQGGVGIDTLTYVASDAAVRVDLGSGLTVGGFAQGDTVSGVENLTGSDFGDRFDGTGIVNVFKGGDGSDVLIGRGGADQLFGGNDDDHFHVVVNNDAAGALYHGGTGRDTLFIIGNAGAEDFTTASFVSVEVLRFDSGFDNDYALTFGAAQFGFGFVEANRPTRGGEELTISIHMDAPELDLSGVVMHNMTAPTDRFIITGTAADEAVTGSSIADLIEGGDGADTLAGGGGNDTIIGGLGADSLDGGDGIDLLDYSASTAGVNLRLTPGTAAGGHAAGDVIAGFEDVLGTDFGDRIDGTIGANRLEGGLGRDLLSGLGGADSLLGGKGNDQLIVIGARGAPGGVLDGGEGTDDLLITGAAGTADFTGAEVTGIERLFFNGTSDGDYGVVFLADQFVFEQLRATGAARGEGALAVGIVMGEATQIDLTGIRLVNFTEDDGYEVTGDADAEEITGSNIADILRGGGGDDSLNGAAGDDRLIGEDGADRLNGGLGEDRIDGGAGDDVLFSAIDGVRDTFFFARGYDTDTVSRFEQGIDLLRLDAGLFEGLGISSGDEVVETFGTLGADGTTLVLDFGEGDVVRLVNTIGFDAASFGADIFIG